jgi:1,4-dihydroxy-2-naphthoate octaprenyltransferase
MQGGVCKVKLLRLIIQLSSPIFILSAVLLYVLGVGIDHYLIGQINWVSFFLGLTWIVFLFLGFQYLNEYFYVNNVYYGQKWWHTPFSGSSGAIGAGRLPRQVALWVGLACLTLTAALTILIFQHQDLSLTSTLILGFIFLGELVFTLPPIRLVTSGYGELSVSIIMVGLIPAMAYLLQGHEIHRLLFMVSFPLAILYLGMLLALEFPAYASDITHGNKPILVRIGWQRGLLLHNILVLGSFVILGMALILGLPLSIGWPVIFVLPVGLFQIWMINRIADGAKPNWNLLILIALSTFGLTTYLLTYTFWTR